MSRKKKSIFLVVLILLIMLSATMGVSFAYMTRSLESRANNFIFSNASITLTEDEWDKLSPDDKIVYPNRHVKKNPTVTNTGANNVYVYIEVKIPKANIKTVDNSENIISASLQKLLTFTPNDGWELMNSYIDGNYEVELYAYTAGALAPEQSTTSLFDEVVFVNMLEGELERGYQFDMPIAAYAIQSKNINVQGDTMLAVMTAAFNAYSAQTQS